MNLMAVDFSNVGDLITLENIKFVITLIVYGATAAVAIYKTGEAAVEKYKRKKSEREKDEAYIALNQASKTMTNVLDGMALLVNSSQNVDDDQKIKFNVVVAKQVSVIEEAESLLKPIIDGLKKDGEAFIEQVKENAADTIVELGATALSKYIDVDKA